jgi:hypothetical protein
MNTLNKFGTHIELLEEPKLLFGCQFTGDDVKEAIETFGTFGTSCTPRRLKLAL